MAPFLGLCFVNYENIGHRYNFVLMHKEHYSVRDRGCLIRYFFYYTHLSLFIFEKWCFMKEWQIACKIFLYIYKIFIKYDSNSVRH